MSAAAVEAITTGDVISARARIATSVRRTPLERSAALSDLAGVPVHLKLECWQPTRSFKVRGAMNSLASLDQAALRAGVVTASAGNHGQAVALAAAALGAGATVFLPRTAPLIKRSRIARLGASIREEFDSYDDAESAAMEYARETGATFVHAFSDPVVIAGQGTVGLEILDDLPQVRTVIVPVGGGGLISGTGLVMRALSPATRVVGVQSVETRAMHAAFAAGHVVDVPVTPTLADGLAGCTDDATFQRARAVVDDIVLVEEAEIAEAIRRLYLDDAVVAEGSAATAAAALLSGRVQPAGDCALIITGGNIDATLLSRMLADTGTPDRTKTTL